MAEIGQLALHRLRLNVVATLTILTSWGVANAQQVAVPPSLRPAVTGQDAAVRFRSANSGPLNSAADAVPIASATRLSAADLDRNQIEQRLRLILGSRLWQKSKGTQRVYELRTGQQLVATLIFDDRRSGVLCQVPAGVLDQLSVLFRALHHLPADSAQRTAVLSIERTDPAQLRQAIDAYQQQAKTPKDDEGAEIRRGYTTGGLALVNFVFQEDATDAAEGEGAEAPARIPPATGGLDVDVDVQTLPDLDVIILRGRDRDVRKLTQIIQELERLSRETQPRVRVYALEHANSAAVVEVLEDVTDDLTVGAGARKCYLLGQAQRHFAHRLG